MDWIEKNKGKATEAQNIARSDGMEGLPPGAVGMVRGLKGEAYAISPGINGAENRRTLHSGDNIMAQDRIVTGKDTSLNITLKDNSMLAVGSDSKLSMKGFSEISENDGRHRTGSMKDISGKLTNPAEGAIRMSVPSAVLGVRG